MPFLVPSALFIMWLKEKLQKHVKNICFCLLIIVLLLLNVLPSGIVKDGCHINPYVTPSLDGSPKQVHNVLALNPGAFETLERFSRLGKSGQWHKSGNTKGGSTTVPLTSCLIGLESVVWLLTIFVFICKTDYSKPVKPFPPLVVSDTYGFW